MGIVVRDRAPYREHGLIMESQQQQQRLCGSLLECGFGCEELQAEPRLPSGWEKCLDLKSGLIYFKDWNSGTLTYRDPRQSPLPASQRIGLLSISLSSDQEPSAKKRKTIPQQDPAHGFTTTRTANTGDYWLELSLHLPGTPSPASRPGTSTTESQSQDGSVCTVEKVRSALERSQWLSPSSMSKTKTMKTAERKCSSPICNGAAASAAATCASDPTMLSLGTTSMSESVATTSPCSSERASECFTSPSVMSFQGDDEEVQQPGGDSRDSSGANIHLQVRKGPQGAINNKVSPVMVTVGCKSCLMYVMLSKSHPSCPRCGNTDVLLELPVASPKKRRVAFTREFESSTPSWSWCTV